MRIWGKKMNRKLLMGSLLVLTLLLLMPSIPAIQHNIIKEDVKNKVLSELSEDLDLNDLKELVDSGKLDRIKHPLLYLLIICSFISRKIRIDMLTVLSVEFIGFHIIIKNPILYKRLIILTYISLYWAWFWYFISQKYGWNWKLIEIWVDA